MTTSEPKRFASRGGEKLETALQAFGVDPTGLVCADLGCNVGGFTDCLLQHGACRVYAIDTGYGELAWKLRQDPRVRVLERTNALHVRLPEPVSLITIDVGWTRQHVILPAARRLLAPEGKIVTLVKPHYEAEDRDLRQGVLLSEKTNEVLAAVRRRLAMCDITLQKIIDSPLTGRKGNREFLALMGQ